MPDLGSFRRNGYPREWTEDSARAFLQYVSAQGGRAIDVFRLLQGGEYDWPHDPFWWTLLEEFVAGTL